MVLDAAPSSPHSDWHYSLFYMLSFPEKHGKGSHVCLDFFILRFLSFAAESHAIRET